MKPKPVQNHSAAASVSVEEERQLRERAMEQLKRSEMRFRHMVENNVVGIIIANFDGRITDANDSFLRMVGYDLSDLKAACRSAG